MLVVSDVHDSPLALARLVSLGDPVLILGDLVNLADYRTGAGAVADVLGLDMSLQSGEARGRGDFSGMRDIWRQTVAESGVDARSEIEAALDRQYEAMAGALAGGTGLVTHGNVDRPELLRRALPDGFRYVHGEVVEAEGMTLGVVGGGMPTPVQAEGELAEDEMTRLLGELGPVDILCTHVPAALRPLRLDVITGREERGSEPVLDYLRQHQPRFHIFGDVHQPQASTWRIGRTRAFNVGYFRATGRFLRLEPGGVAVGGLG